MAKKAKDPDPRNALDQKYNPPTGDRITIAVPELEDRDTKNKR